MGQQLCWPTELYLFYYICSYSGKPPISPTNIVAAHFFQQSLTLMLVLATAILHLYYLTRDEGYTFKAALGHAPGSAVAVGLCLVVVWPLLALTLYHVRVSRI